MKHARILGAPTTAGCRPETSHLMSQDQAPQALREALKAYCSGFDLGLNYQDDGDLSLVGDLNEILKEISSQLSQIFDKDSFPIVLGGVHTISVGTLRAVKEAYPDFSLIYFDAHPDIMPRSELDYGSSLFHSIQEGTLEPKRMVYVGARKIERPEAELIEKLKIPVITPQDFHRKTLAELSKEFISPLTSSIYVSLDLDSMDPTFAPGVTSPTPIGLSPTQVLGLLEEICNKGCIGLEMVELSPKADIGGRTAELAAAILAQVVTRCEKKA